MELFKYGLILCHAVVSALTAVNAYYYEKCNETINVDENMGRLTLKSPEALSRSDRGKEIYCWFKFEGTTAQTIEIDVKDVRLGEYDETIRDCTGGYLRISDSESCSIEKEWFPPTTLCGYYQTGQLRVKRYTRSNLAFVEFKLESARPSLGYEFDVTFLDNEDEIEMPYGNLQKQKGRIKDTKCDWLIPVETCFGFCDVVSPGFPGIYPPNTRCRYLLTNFEDDRVELKMGGRGFTGRFDMKRDPNCSSDYVEVYDGMSTANPLIGRFCGQDGKHIISSGSSLLLIFQTGPGGPPWDYSGFKVTVLDRWKNQHEGGEKIPKTTCDWLFDSADSDEGDLHTPDYMLKDKTNCYYDFTGAFHETVGIDIVVNYKNDSCSEYIEILENDKVMTKICAMNMTRRIRRKEFTYNSTGPYVTVRYVSQNGQVANANPMWIYYKFHNKKDKPIREVVPRKIRPSSTYNEKTKNGGVLEVRSNSPSGGSEVTISSKISCLLVCLFSLVLI